MFVGHHTQYIEQLRNVQLFLFHLWLNTYKIQPSTLNPNGSIEFTTFFLKRVSKYVVNVLNTLNGLNSFAKGSIQFAKYPFIYYSNQTCGFH